MPVLDPEFAAMLPVLLWVIFGASVALSIALGALLTYHWFRYAMSPVMSLVALSMYAVGCFVLLGGLFAATLVLA